MTLRELLNWGKKQLKEEGISEFDLDAWLLLEHVTGISKALFFVKDHETVSSACQETYQELVKRRCSHIPLQHLTNCQEFMGYDFYVNENVLIPRQDTEILVEEALKVLENSRESRILDLCCGSGCILLSLLKIRENDRGVGADLSEKALKVAEMNRERLDIASERAELIQSDLFQNIRGEFDLIVSNPPYIKTAEIETLQDEVKLHDPFMALDGKEDGLYFYRRIIAEAGASLKSGGILLFEIGYDQGEAVKNIMETSRYEKVTVKKDLAGLDRVVGGVYNKAREK